MSSPRSTNPASARSAPRAAWIGRISLACLLAAGSLSVACQSAYYSAMETFGVHKREILVDRVQDARADQAQAKQLFVSTFDRFKALTNYDGGQLEKRYQALNSEYEACHSKAEDVRKRISSVEDVAGALFEEWRTEIGQIQDPKIRERSRTSLDATKKRYGEMLDTMKRAASGMDPVLTAFHDHVLGLKHDLNAHAIASLASSVSSIQDDVANLIESMQKSIQEADAFIESMKSP